ncbi:MAG: magnesium transporter CorA family protein [Breznakibacter sp.]
MEEILMMTFYTYNKGYTPASEWTPNCWVNVECPTEDDRNFLLYDLNVPESFLNDIDDTDERPRIEEEDGWYLIILRAPYRPTDNSLMYATIPLGIIIYGDICITVCNHQTEVIPDFINYSNRKQVVVNNPYDLVMRLLLSTSVWYLKYLKQINIQMKTVEGELQHSVRNKDLQSLQKIENCLVFFITSLKGNEVLFFKLKHQKALKDFYDEELIEDVDIELKQAQETTSIHRNILNSMMNVYASVISNNLNSTMKQLTSISIIIMLPTLVASLYGMNVPNFLENNPNGLFYIISGSMLLSAAGIYAFKRKNFF